MKKNYLALLHHRYFRLLWLGQTTSQFGNIFYEIALIWLALQITHQNYPSIGLVIFARFLPYLLFGLLGGAYSDRWNRRYTMIVCEGLSGIVVVLLPILDILGKLALWHLAAVAFLLSLLRVFFMPSLQASLPDVVPEEQLAKANGLMHSSFQLVEVVGPLVAGSLFVIIPPRNLFLFDSLTFFVSVITLLFVRLPLTTSRPQTTQTNIIRDVFEIFQMLREVPIVLLSILLFGVEVLANAGLLRLGLPAYTIQILRGGTQTYGLLVSGMALGTIIGALFAGLVSNTTPKFLGAAIFLCWAGYGAFLGLLPLTNWLPLALMLVILAGSVGAFVDVLMTMLIQRHVPKNGMGRAFSLWSTLANIGESASSPLTGMMLGFFGFFPAFIGCSLFTVIGGLLSFLSILRGKQTIAVSSPQDTTEQAL
jgi:MFS transporter, DHA3 family, macrolide efflux protein